MANFHYFKVLANSRQISHITNRDMSGRIRVGEKYVKTGLMEISQVFRTVEACPETFCSETFLYICLNTFFVISEIYKLLGSSFLPKYSKIDATFRNGAKKCWGSF